MNCLIVDDDSIARATLRQLASLAKDLVVAGECENAVDAYHLLQEQPIDLIFLDIEMPGMTGLELTRNLGSKKPIIIFITSKKDYALDAFELNVVDYILKPVTTARFLQAVDKAKEVWESASEEVKLDDDEFIFIRDSNIIKRLKLDEILYVEAMGDYAKLHTAKRFFAVHATLKMVEQRLPASRFLRVHRSYMVPIAKIDSIQDGMIVIAGKTIPVADAYRAALNKRMNVL